MKWCDFKQLFMLRCSIPVHRTVPTDSKDNRCSQHKTTAVQQAAATVVELSKATSSASGDAVATAMQWQWRCSLAGASAALQAESILLLGAASIANLQCHFIELMYQRHRVLTAMVVSKEVTSSPSGVKRHISATRVFNGVRDEEVEVGDNVTISRGSLLPSAISIGTEVYSTPIQEIDLENILQYAQERENKPDKKDREIFGSLKSQEIADLVQKATEDKVFNDQTDKREYRDAEELLSELTSKHKNRNNKNDKVKFGHYYVKGKDYDKNALENVEDNEFDDNDERYKSSRFNEQALEELLSKNVKKYNNLKPRLASLSNAGSVDLNNDRNDDDDDADEYSKVYIILNPQAIEKSSNKKNLNKLLSKILSLTSSPASPLETGRNKKYKGSSRYKGFPVKSRLSRRARHDSVDREVYASGDDDYKPKRGRSERGSGGGGGAGGRTAIPYIRNRGDIYERDH